MDLRKNLLAKIIALAIAFGLWAWVAGQADVIKTLRIPVDVTGLPADLELVGNPIDDVTVRLRGPEITLRTLAPEKVRVRLNLANQPVSAGKNTFPLTPDMVTAPAGVRIDPLKPSFLDLQLERTQAKEVAVHAEIRGEPAAGFEVAGTVVQPPRLVIEGPESAVQKIETLTTPTIPVDGKTSNLTLRVRPVAAGPSAPAIRLVDPSATVQVLVRIRPIQMERTLDGVALVAEGRTAGGLAPELDVSSVQVEVSGPRNLVAQLAPEHLGAFVDVTGLTREASEVDASTLAIRPLDTATPAWQDLRFQVTSPAVIRLSWRDPPAD
ncbi:MAG: YbbR-like domain-containing protein [Acidobacteriota bacterium]